MLRKTFTVTWALSLGSVAMADDDAALRNLRSIGVYTVIEKGDAIPPDVSVFMAGYLENIKGYAAYNLDQYYVNSEKEARARAVELGIEAVLVAKVEGFEAYENTAKTKLRLVDAKRGKKLKSWKAKLRAPYFDSPRYLHVEPYGNLDDVFHELPAKTHPIARRLRLLVLSDQQLEGPGEPTRRYLESQLAIASRTLAREFGVALDVHKIERWLAPETDIFSIAEAATAIAGRDEVDLTLVCIGPLAPARVRARAIGYARVLTNIVVNRQMNAHVFVHEIGHVLGAIHINQEGCVMEPMLRSYELANRFQVLPPILFSDTNRSIINLTRFLPLGTAYQPNQEKIARLLNIYEDLQSERLREVAPYYGDLLLSVGRYDEALEVLRAGQRVDPNNASIRYSLRQALVESGQYSEAQKLLQEDFDLRKGSLQRASKGRHTLEDFALMKVSPSISIFGTVRVGERQRRQLTIASLGTLTLELSAIELTGTSFRLLPGTLHRATVKPGESLDIELEYLPSAPGRHSATLRLESNAMYQESVEIRLAGQAAE